MKSQSSEESILNKIHRCDGLSLCLDEYGINDKMLQKILPEIRKLKKLEILDLSENQITTINESTFDGLTNLETLHLKENKITIIDENAFKGLANLEILDLVGNQITTIAANAFNGLENLETLHLKENKITIIDENAFKGLTNLETLNLCENKITTIAANAFEYLTELKELSLDANQIMSLHDNIIRRTNNNDLRISLEGNPLGTAFLAQVSDMINITTNMAAYDKPTSGAAILKLIYKDDIIPKEIYSYIDSRDVFKPFLEEFDAKIPQTIVPILQTFLSKVGATSGWNDINVRNKIMIPAIKFIFDKLKNNKEDTVSSIATSLGDCSTPVNDYIQQQFIDMQAQKNQQLRRCDLEKMAFIDYINKKIKLTLNERIEIIHGLANCMYLENSNHPIKISGQKHLTLSGTVYIDYLHHVFKGLDEKYGIANKFTDLCCKKDKNGNLIRDDEKMDKIYYGYLAKNINLVYSKDKKDKIDKIIQNIKAAINSDVYHNLLYINCDNQDVIKLIESVDNIDVRFLKAIDGLTDEKQINDKSKKIIDFMNTKIDLISKKIDMNNKELISAIKKAEIRPKKVIGDLGNTGWINTLAKRSI